MYDVFLAHNSKDERRVRALRDALVGKKLSVFFDKEDVVEEELVSQQIEEALGKTLVPVLCFGTNGLGPVHSSEIDIVLRANLHKKKSMVTVILPGANEDVRPETYRGYNPVIFENEMTERRPLDKICRAVERARKRHESAAKTDQVPARESPVIATSSEDIKRHLKELRKSAREQPLNFLIGPLTGLEAPVLDRELAEAGAEGAEVPGFGEPSPYELARQLGEKAQLNAQLPAAGLTPIETVAHWCLLKKGYSQLEDDLRQILAGPVGDRRGQGFYDTFAELIAMLIDRPVRRRRGSDNRPLIFTTNPGLSLEKALLRAGISFSRIVVKLPGMLDIRRFRVERGQERHTLFDLNDVVDGEPEPLGRFSVDCDAHAMGRVLDLLGEARPEFAVSATELDRDSMSSDAAAPVTPENLSFDGMEGCIIFKYHGSVDVSGSCIVSSEQLFQLTLERHIVPNEVLERLRLKPSVVLGTSILLAEVQQTMQAVLAKAFGEKKATLHAATTIPRVVVPRDHSKLSGMPDAWLHKLDHEIQEEFRYIASRLGLKVILGGQKNFLEQLQREMTEDPVQDIV